MYNKLDLLEERYEELNRLLAQPDVATDPGKLREYGQEQAEIQEVVEAYRQYKDITAELESTRAMLDDSLGPEMQELVEEEIEALEDKQAQLQDQIRVMLLPRDPRDQKNVIMEIRAGTGGEEAALFASDLYRMYSRYAENQGWRTDILNANRTGIGGFKEVIFEVQGRGAYSRLKYESGVHRVQRVPKTEASGRIHTSTATVAVLPEIEEVEIHVDPDDLRIDVYGASGPGGQHMQKNATAVRITHTPTGIVVACESERSQFQNRQRAMAVLRARLYDLEEQKRQEELAQTRRSQVGTGERAEKIRTYNFPQNRITDHRIGLTSYALDRYIDGELDEFVEALISAEQAEKLAALELS